MKKRLMFSLSIVPLLMLVSCSGSPEEQSATPPSPPTGQASPPPVAPPPATPPAISSQSIAALGLIPSTNPQQRLKEVQQARNNPFSLIPIVAQVVPSGGVDNSGNSQGTNNFNNGSKSGNSQGMNESNNGNQSGSNNKRLGSKITKTPNIGRKTSIQQSGEGFKSTQSTENTGFCQVEQENRNIGVTSIAKNTQDARGMNVYGVIQFQEGPIAIVKSRNQPVAISIAASSRLGGEGIASNPPVFVKSIKGGDAGFITLEQDGELITRRIGQPEEADEAVTRTRLNLNPDALDAVVDGLVLTKAEFKGTQGQYVVSGTVCNKAYKNRNGKPGDAIVSKLNLQIVDEKNVVLDSATATLGSYSDLRKRDTGEPTDKAVPYRLLKNGGTGIFKSEPLNLDLRDRDPSKVRVMLTQWEP